MGIIPDVEIIHAKVMHHRLKPKVNKFIYSAFYVCLPFTSLNQVRGNWLFGWNKAALFSFHSKDHGEKALSLEKWLSQLLEHSNIKNVSMQSVKVITMPRVLGYVFNPVSFWIIPDQFGNMIAIICEVNNTFGERHSYICLQKDGQTIQSSDMMEADKVFHVSPFLQRNGSYRFKFSLKEKFFASIIDYLAEDKSPILLTSVSGEIKKATSRNLLYAFLLYPLMTIKVMWLIHWQALIIFLKGIKYIPKPEQVKENYSTTDINA